MISQSALPVLTQVYEPAFLVALPPRSAQHVQPSAATIRAVERPEKPRNQQRGDDTGCGTAGNRGPTRQNYIGASNVADNMESIAGSYSTVRAGLAGPARIVCIGGFSSSRCFLGGRAVALPADAGGRLRTAGRLIGGPADLSRRAAKDLAAHTMW